MMIQSTQILKLISFGSFSDSAPLAFCNIWKARSSKQRDFGFITSPSRIILLPGAVRLFPCVNSFVNGGSFFNFSLISSCVLVHVSIASLYGFDPFSMYDRACLSSPPLHWCLIQSLSSPPVHWCLIQSLS